MRRPRTVYTDTDIGRLGAVLDPANGIVHVWYSNGGTIGGYRLARFRDGKVTAATVRELFARENWVAL